MAPDLSGSVRPPVNAQAANTTSSSTQQSPNLSRRTSSIMGPPPPPQNSSLANSPRQPALSMDSGAFAVNPGPIRHPRPLTAAELHLELEKEQESIVNRLTRELSALRAQTASVASTASSTSDLFTTPQNDPYLYSYNAPNIIPTTARRHRSSSNLSSRSARSTRDTLANAAAGATSVSGVAAPRDRDRERERDRDREHPPSHSQSHSHQTSSRPSIDIPRPDISRHNSTSGGINSSTYRTVSSSGMANPSATSPHWSAHAHHHPHARHSVSSSFSTSAANAAGGEGYARSPSASMTAAQAQARYEEAAMQRTELDAVKRENEALRLKIKELERSLAERTAEKNGATTVADGDDDGGVAVSS